MKIKLLFMLLIWGFLFTPPSIYSQESESQNIQINQKSYPRYPTLLQEIPEIPSPFRTASGEEIIIGITKYGKYTLIPVTVENSEPSDYTSHKIRKGRELGVNSTDFPTLARIGLHSEIELAQTRMITGRSIAEITDSGRPESSSGAGFMAQDEDIISVLRGDNRLMKKVGLTHPLIVKPLFHIWNLILKSVEMGVWTNDQIQIESIIYNNHTIFLKNGGRGYQESIFNDEIKGAYHLEMWRELDQNEKTFLADRYSNLPPDKLADLMKKLAYIHTGEMVPYYIQWYGFYEGHTDYRADPIAIAVLFNLKSITEIEKIFEGNLYRVLTNHFTSENSSDGKSENIPRTPFKGGIIESPPLKGDLGGCKAFPIDHVN